MNTAEKAKDLHKHVPPNWYFQSIEVERNPFQRYWHARRFKEIRTLIEPTDGRILDLGCADGVFTRVIADASRAREVIGVDVLEESVRWANEHWKEFPSMRFQSADAHALPFEDASFDAALSLEMLEHVVDPARVLGEMRRVLRPGGYIVLLVPSDNLLFRVIWHFWTKWRGMIWEGTHIQSFQHRALGRVAEEQGFSIEKEYTFLLGMLYVVKARKPSAA